MLLVGTEPGGHCGSEDGSLGKVIVALIVGSSGVSVELLVFGISLYVACESLGNYGNYGASLG